MAAPRQPQGRKRKIMARFYCNTAESNLLRRAAELDGDTFSTFVRKVALKRARDLCRAALHGRIA